jgi:hypothetical protein
MTDRDISTDVLSLQADVLDHSREFVELVYRSAPDEYRRLVCSVVFRGLLEEENNFNHGKVYAYAEYMVFSREFIRRFPEASPAACINAFSKLFLKNDISISNLVNFIEAWNLRLEGVHSGTPSAE